jgi:hypothetical protein
MTPVHCDHQGICPRPHCGGTLRKKLCDDAPGAHSYVWACKACHHEYGEEWVEYHHRARPSLHDER